MKAQIKQLIAQIETGEQAKQAVGTGGDRVSHIFPGMMDQRLFDMPRTGNGSDW